MEKIREAMKKARDARGAGGERDAQPRAASSNASLTAPIEYSETQVQSADTQRMHANRLMVSGVDDAASSAYKMLRTQVEQRMSQNGWNTLAVTSPVAGVGSTLTSINLALSMAREVHRTVLLADLNLREPKILSRFGFAPARGLVDYLLDDVPISSLLINPGIEHLVVLPSSRQVQNSSELLASPKMGQLVDELKSRYASRMVIFDLPPLLTTDDALAFIPHIEAVLMVVEDGVTTKDELGRAAEMLGQHNLLGVVLNRAES